MPDPRFILRGRADVNRTQFRPVDRPDLRFDHFHTLRRVDDRPGLIAGRCGRTVWPNYGSILMVLGVFLVGQFVEGNVLSPKLVGDSVGLHPVWLIFALLAFGYLFGFVGLLVAVPLAATIGVVSRFALRRYLQSSFYTGENLD